MCKSDKITLGKHSTLFVSSTLNIMSDPCILNISAGIPTTPKTWNKNKVTI